SLSKATDQQTAELYDLLHVKRFYDPQTHPYGRELLAIEFTNGFVLRKNQVDTIAAMLQKPNQIKQLGMGAGKSSVVLPTLLKKLADGQRMAVGIIPEWLYETVAKDLDKSCRDIFGQEVFSLEFDRSIVVDTNYLLDQYIHLAKSIKDKNVVITTKTSILSLRNKYLELQKACQKDPSREDLKEQLKWLGKIVGLLKNHGSCIADEVDTILDVRQELNYAIGDPEPLPLYQRSMGVDIFRKIGQWTTGDFQAYANKIRHNRQAELSSPDIKKIQHQLAEDFYGDFTSLGVKKDVFVTYLTSQAEEGGTPQFMSELKSSDEDAFNKIASLRHFLIDTFPTILTRSGQVDYGRSPETPETIPYQGSNTPTKSMFGESSERIAYTVMDYLQKGLDKHQVQSFISRLIGQLESEMQEHRIEEGVLGDYWEMQTFRTFNADYQGIDLIKAHHDPKERAKLLACINTSDESKLKFVENWVLPNLKAAREQVSSNAHDFVELSYEFSGFTGTTWNTRTFHAKVSKPGSPDALAEAKTKGTDGKSIDFLLATVSSEHIRVVDTEGGDILGAIKGGLPSGDSIMGRYSALIDTGAYFKGVSNAEVAQKLAGLEGKGGRRAVAYVDSNNDKVLQDFGTTETTLLSQRRDIRASQRFSYYDQPHTIGTDIPHDAGARAAVTIGENTYIKDLLQSIWRMRKLGKDPAGQKVDFIVSQGVEALIRDVNGITDRSTTLDIEHIIRFCVANQAKREADDNLRAEYQKIMGMLPQGLLDMILAAGNPEEGRRLFELCHAHLFKTIGTTPDAWAQNIPEVVTTEALEALTKQTIQKCEELQQAVQGQFGSENSFVKGLKDIISRLKNRRGLSSDVLPEKTRGAPADEDSQVETQQEQEQQQQMSIQAEAAPPPDLREHWDSWEANDVKALWDAAGERNSLGSILRGFDSEISFTTNFIPGDEQLEETEMAKALTRENRIPAYQLLVMKKEGEWRTLMLDINDYEQVVASALQEKGDIQAAVIDVRSSPATVIRSNVEGNKSPWASSEYLRQVASVSVQARFYNGEVDYNSKVDREVLREWLQKDTDGKRSLFEQHFMRSQHRNRYSDSFIGKLFSELG
ncbi:MAG: DUF3638 domain-containing protein, partial [Chlamydiota bacterium]